MRGSKILILGLFVLVSLGLGLSVEDCSVEIGFSAGNSCVGDSANIDFWVRNADGVLIDPTSYSITIDGPDGSSPVSSLVQRQYIGKYSLSGVLTAPSGDRALTVQGFAGDCFFESGLIYGVFSEEHCSLGAFGANNLSSSCSSDSDCPADYVCRLGNCRACRDGDTSPNCPDGGGRAPTCADDCSIGQNRCDPTNSRQIQECKYDSSEKCNKWVTDALCSSGKICSSGSCVDDSNPSGGGKVNPNAAFTYSPSSLKVGDIIRLDGGGSKDPDGGSITEYAWDIKNDGSFQGRSSSSSYSFVISQSDVANSKLVVKLEVTDDEGQKDTLTKSIGIQAQSGGSGGDPEITRFDPQPASGPSPLFVKFSYTYNDNGANMDTVTIYYGDNASTSLSTSSSSGLKSHTYDQEGKYIPYMEINYTAVDFVGKKIVRSAKTVTVGDDLVACQDNDGDGFGAVSSSTCRDSRKDCNDFDASVNWDAAEICDDDIDNNCNGNIDDSDDACKLGQGDKPDFRPQNLILEPASPKPNEDVTYTVDIINNGNNVSGSLDVVFSAGSRTICTKSISVPTQNTPVSCTDNAKRDSGTTYTLTVKVDPNDDIDEENENNNQISKQISVNMGSVDFTCEPGELEYLSGQSIGSSTRCALGDLPDFSSPTQKWVVSGPGQITGSDFGKAIGMRHDVSKDKPTSNKPLTIDVKVTVTDRSSGEKATASKQIRVKMVPLPVALAVMPSGVSSNSLSVFSGQSQVEGGTVNSFWDLGDGNTEIGSDIKHTYSKEGTYSLVYGVLDDLGNGGLFVSKVKVTEDGKSNVDKENNREAALLRNGWNLVFLDAGAFLSHSTFKSGCTNALVMKLENGQLKQEVDLLDGTEAYLVRTDNKCRINTDLPTLNSGLSLLEGWNIVGATRDIVLSELESAGCTSPVVIGLELGSLNSVEDRMLDGGAYLVRSGASCTLPPGEPE